VLGLLVITLFVALALFAPFVAPYDPTAQIWTAVRKSALGRHWFGTDDVGRDILSRIIYGARASLLAGVVSVAIAIAIGVPVGMVAGYLGGFTDALLSRMTDAMLACPFLILAIALAAFLGPSLTNAMIAIGITATPIFVRLTRGQVMGGQGRGLCRGGPRHRQSTLAHCARPCLAQHPADLDRAGDSVDGGRHHRRGGAVLPRVGQQPPSPSWGGMLNSAQRFLVNEPWMAVWPGLAIFLTVLSFNLVGDGLRDALDPRER